MSDAIGPILARTIAETARRPHDPMPPAPDPDHDPEHDDPEIRRAKTVLFLLTAGLLVAVSLVLLAFRPRDQVRVERYPNGYPRTRTHYVLDAAGRPVEQGEHQAWHADGTLSEEGRYDRGERTGPWRFWATDGTLDAERSGLYAAGQRTGALEER